MEKLNEETQKNHNKITADTVLFFDMDGTLIDTNFSNFLAYKRAILFVTSSAYNLLYNPNKRFTRSVLKVAIPNLTEVEYEQIIREKEEFYNEFLHETKLNKTVEQILNKYSKTNRTVLVSNCRKDRAMITLNHFGIADKFSNIFCREFGDNEQKINKFQNAITKLGISPTVVIAFENEESEIADAQKAGIIIINPIHL